MKELADLVLRLAEDVRDHRNESVQLPEGCTAMATHLDEIIESLSEVANRETPPDSPELTAARVEADGVFWQPAEAVEKRASASRGTSLGFDPADTPRPERKVVLYTIGTGIWFHPEKKDRAMQLAERNSGSVVPLYAEDPLPTRAGNRPVMFAELNRAGRVQRAWPSRLGKAYGERVFKSPDIRSLYADPDEEIFFRNPVDEPVTSEIEPSDPDAWVLQIDGKTLRGLGPYRTKDGAELAKGGSAVAVPAYVLPTAETKLHWNHVEAVINEVWPDWSEDLPSHNEAETWIRAVLKVYGEDRK